MSDPSILTNLPLEQQAIRAKCFHPTGTFVEFEKEDLEQSIPDRFEQIVAKYPDRIAVKTNKAALTYRELNRMANRIACSILARCAETKEPIALLLETSEESIAAILGVLKAGKMYLPLDPSYPYARLIDTLQDCQSPLILSDLINLPLGRELTSGHRLLLCLEDLDADLSTRCPARSSVSTDAVAAIFYTSGSTGQPKGVIQTHRNILDRVMLDTNNFHICPDDRLSLLTSPTYGASLRTLFGALLTGATVCPFNIQNKGVGHLADWLTQEEISIYFSVPTVFRHFADNLRGEDNLSAVRLISLAGEGVAKRDLDLYKQYFSPDCIFVNSLASNEAGIIRQYFVDKKTEIEGTLVPAGYVVDAKEILLLDDAGQEVGYGQVGQIAVRSGYLSPGYWRKPDLTASSFLADSQRWDQRIYLTGDLGRMLPDGCLLYLGRKDGRVKIRGIGIEVAEIETALLNLPSIKEVVVKAREDGFGDKRLVAYIVAAGEPAPSVSELRSFLSERLPDYMVPSAFIFLKSLPQTPTGKVDRLALPDPGKSRPALDTPFVASRTAVEEKLATAWAEVLSLDQVGIHDNFFDLGGHSLAATRILSQVIKKFQLELPLKTLFDSPTVVEMAEVIMQNQAKKGSDQDLERILSELEAMPDEEVGRKLASTRAS
jgi:amino acid adenylation domain-containing protein